VREIRADPCYPDSLFYRYDFDDDLSRIVVNPSCGVNMKEYELTPCYNSSVEAKEGGKPAEAGHQAGDPV